MATSDGCSTFTSLLNFRDLGASINHFSNANLLRPALFYRSARPDSATPSDRKRLTNDYKVKTIIDLRTPTEHIEQARKHAAAATPSQPAVAPAEPLAPVRMPEIRYEDVNLNGSSYSNALIKQLSYHLAAKLIFYYAFGWRKDAIAILASNVMAARGLSGLAIDSLLYSRAEVKSIFSILCNADSYPVLVHCTQGKDRTGLTVLLVLMLCNVPIEAIEKDYRLSESELQPERQEKLEEIRSISLPDDFADCPAEWTRTVCAYINEELGGVETYLESCDVTREQQERLRRLLVVNSGGV
jgi:protein tyrosine/serine phosphatase